MIESIKVSIMPKLIEKDFEEECEIMEKISKISAKQLQLLESLNLEDKDGIINTLKRNSGLLND